MNIFELVASLRLDDSEYEQGLDNAEKSASSRGAGIGSALATAGKVGGAAIGLVATAATAMGGALVSSTNDVASYGDNIDKMSQKMGISAEAYQEWEAVMQHSGTSMATLKAGMKTLANAVQSGNGAFERLGITQEQIASMSQEDLFAATITALQNVDNETERTYLAGQLLGRGATELGALLNTSAEDTQAMKDRVHELGGVMSDEAVKAAAAYQDQLQDMQTAFSGLSRNLLSEFLPSITGVMSGLTEIFAGNYDEGIEQISEGIDNVITNLTETLPKALDVGVNIVGAIATSLLENIPSMLPALVDLVLGIGEMIIQNLPLLVETALEIVLQLALGIAEALPTLIPTIVDVILTIVDTLIENIDLLVDAAIALMVGLAEGLIEALPRLIEKAPEIVIKLVEAIIRNAPKILQAAVELIITLVDGIVQSFGKLIEVGAELVQKVKDGFAQKVEDAKNWGKDMIQNFIDGILEKWNHLKETVSNVAQTVKDFLGFSEPTEGPLSNFHTYAPDMMDLFIKGIQDSEDALKDQISSTFDFSPTIGTQSVQTQTMAESASPMPINVSVYLEGDAQGIFRVVRTENDIFTRANGVSAFA